MKFDEDDAVHVNTLSDFPSEREEDDGGGDEGNGEQRSPLCLYIGFLYAAASVLFGCLTVYL